jgi:uncharacterized protein (DUF58 family)
MATVNDLLDPALVQRLNQLRLSISARSLVQGSAAGAHRAPFKGSSVEFRHHRFYIPGDEPRRIDWRVLARTDRAHVREFDEETNLRCMILIDRSGSMRYGNKFAYACKLTAALAYLMLSGGESVGVSLCAKRAEPWLPPHRGVQQLSRLIAVMRAEPEGALDSVEIAREACTRLDRRALVILVSDFFQPIPTLSGALARLEHDRHELIALRVLHRDEIDFPFRHWLKVRSLEAGHTQTLDAALARKQYLRNFQRHQRELSSICLARRARLTELLTDQPIADALVGIMKQRMSPAMRG